MISENKEMFCDETSTTLVPANEVVTTPAELILRLPDEVFTFEYLIGNNNNEVTKGLYTFSIRVPRTFEEFNDCFGSYYIPLSVGDYGVSIPVILNEDEVAKNGIILIQRAVRSWANNLCKLNNLNGYKFKIGSVTRVTSSVIKEWANFVDPITRELDRIVDGSRFTISNCYQTLTAPNSAYTKFIEISIDDYLAGSTLVDDPDSVITKTFDCISSDTELLKLNK